MASDFQILVIRGTPAYRTDDRISKLVRRAWGKRAHWWTIHFDDFALVCSKPYEIRHEIGWDQVKEKSDTVVDNRRRPD